MSTGSGRQKKRASSSARASDVPLVVPPKEAARLLSLGISSVYMLMRTGELQNYEDGRNRRIITTSIHDYIARRLAAGDGKWQQWRYSPSRRRERQRSASPKAAAPSKRRARTDQHELTTE